MFVKGQSGNPNGRPKKGKTLTDLLEKELAGKFDAEGDDGEVSKITGKVAVIRQIIALGFGDRVPPDTKLAALKYIFDRIDGTPVQKTENKNVTLPAIIEVDLNDPETDTGDSSAVEGEDQIQDS